MAPSPLANDAGERYAELERAYTEDRWPDVLKQGGQLIADLSNDPSPVTAELVSRAQLLLGHAHLYGLRDPAAAQPYYQAVLAGPADPDLRRIAEEALPFCQPAVTPTAAPAEELSTDAVALESASAGAAAEMVTPASSAGAKADAGASPAVAQGSSPWSTIEPTAEPLGDRIIDADGPWFPRAGTAAAAITEPATPWLDQTTHLEKPAQSEGGGMLAAPASTIREDVPSLEVEVVEEPELMEVAQADPSLAEELELELMRIRERRAARRGHGAATDELVSPDPAPSHEEQDNLLDDPELLASLLRVVVRP